MKLPNSRSLLLAVFAFFACNITFAQISFGPQTAVQPVVPINKNACVFYDLDEDGDEDILCGSNSKFCKLGWLIQNGEGEYSEQQCIDLPINFTFSENAYITHLKLVDMDSDGDLDAVVAVSSVDEIGWLEFENGSVLSYTLIASEVAFVDDLEANDINGDNAIDVAWTANSSLAWGANNGGGDFYSNTTLGEWNYNQIELADMNGDGTVDLVVFGKVGKGTGDSARSAKCIHGGAAFVWPVIQDYAFLDLTPISIEVDLMNALSRQNIRVNVPSRFTVGISTEPGIMTNAAERLLGQGRQEIHDLAKDIIFGQLRLVVATMDIEEINSNRDKFLANVASNVEAELKKIGLKLINVNVTDITDESGYISALGKEAAAKAINDAKQSVAEKNRDGSIGEANAVRSQRIEVASANAQANIGEAGANQRERVSVADANAIALVGEADAQKIERVQTSDANARAVEGENTAKIDIANSDAIRRENEAEAKRRAIAAEKVKEAKALEEAYQAQKLAEDQRATRDRASKQADVIVPAEIAKQKAEIEAEIIE